MPKSTDVRAAQTAWSLAVMVALFSMLTARIVSAQPVAETEESSRSILSVTRIEVTAFGGLQGGGTFLALPPIDDPTRTFDTAADQVLDFSGMSLPGDLEAVQKQIEDAPLLGAKASFFFGSNFGMQLIGSYAKTEASLTAQYKSDLDYETDPPAGERFEYDRSDVSILKGGGNITYNIGKERKMKIWPYVSLGFGGLLIKYPETDDMGALYFLYGGGISLKLGGSIRLQLGADFTLFSYDQDEVNLNETMTLPAFTLGLTWRHEVPDEMTMDADNATPAAGPPDTGR
jgi:hypothetical protein